VIEIINCEQGSPEWHAARAGIVTASEFATVLAKGRGGGESKTRRTYMLRLLGERLTGEVAESYSNGHMERGKALEAEARDAYAFLHDADYVQVGFIRNGDAGASPDGLIGADGMVEIKTKLPHLQLDVLLTDEVPSEHIAQCQGALWIAEREWIDFVSYWPKLPLFVKRIHRDEAYIERLAAAVAEFNAELAQLQQRFQ